MQRSAASSHAAWALLTEGVTSARLEAHRLRHLVARAMSLVSASSQKDHIHEVAGDILQALPTRMDALDRDLDRTSYALAVFGEDYLRDVLPMTDRKLVDDAKAHARPFSALQTIADRVAMLHTQADLSPQLGYPGGPCQVAERATKTVRNPRVLQSLVEGIETGEDLSNPDAAQIYKPLAERGPQGTPIAVGDMLFSAHAQYRMDLRYVAVPQVRAALSNFAKEWAKLKSQKHPTAIRWESSMAHGESIQWVDPKLGLTVVFKVTGAKRDFTIITSYWTKEPDPRPPGEGGCAL